MIIFLECVTIVDNVNFFAEADKSRLRPDELALLKECAQIRAELKPYTTMDVLVGKVRDGENIMLKKVLIDKYHKAQVDLVPSPLNLVETVRQTQPAM